MVTKAHKFELYTQYNKRGLESDFVAELLIDVQGGGVGIAFRKVSLKSTNKFLQSA